MTIQCCLPYVCYLNLSHIIGVYLNHWQNGTRLWWITLLMTSSCRPLLADNTQSRTNLGGVFRPFCDNCPVARNWQEFTFYTSSFCKYMCDILFMLSGESLCVFWCFICVVLYCFFPVTIFPNCGNKLEFSMFQRSSVPPYYNSTFFR